MDFGLSFGYFFQDDEWIKKLIIGSVLVLLAPITFGLSMLPLYGWVVAIVGNVNKGTEPTLPEWADFGKLIVDGLKAWAIGLIWALPIILISFCISALSAVAGDSESLALAAAGVSGLFTLCVVLPYSIILALLVPAAIGQLGDDAEFSTAINPMNAYNLVRANFAGYIIVLLVGWFVVPLISLVGLLICLIGYFPALTYAAAMIGHLMGQAYRESAAAGGLQPTSA